MTFCLRVFPYISTLFWLYRLHADDSKLTGLFQMLKYSILWIRPLSLQNHPSNENIKPRGFLFHFFVLPFDFCILFFCYSLFYLSLSWKTIYQSGFLTQPIKFSLHLLCPDNSEQMKVVLSLERKELRRYSVWEQQDMEAQDIYFKCDGKPSPPTVLVLCVSQTAAAAVHRDLLSLCLKQDKTNDIGK